MEKKIQTITSLSTHSFSAHLDEVLLKDGKMGKRVKIDHPEAAAVIPFISDHEIIMVRQFRYALGGETLEIPSGKVDPGEKVEACAKRELVEETGYEAVEIKFIYTYAPAIGYSNELIHIYSARNLKKANIKIDEREIISLERLNIERIKELIRKGLILDSKTLIGLSMIGLAGS
jgi:ADP-ribose pyrophosphatase